MQRRHVLRALSGLLVGGLAGCSGQSESPSSTEAPPPTTRTPSIATETPRPTATPAPEPVPHALGERFVVDGDEVFAYTIHGLWTANRLSTTRAPDEQLFVVVDCTVEAIQTPQPLVPMADIWLRDTGTRRSVSRAASNAAGYDGRISRQSLVDIPIREPTRGVIAFAPVPRAPPDYRLLFSPPSTNGPISVDPTRTHRVPVGSLAQLDQI